MFHWSFITFISITICKQILFLVNDDLHIDSEHDVNLLFHTFSGSQSVNRFMIIVFRSYVKRLLLGNIIYAVGYTYLLNYIQELTPWLPMLGLCSSMGYGQAFYSGICSEKKYLRSQDIESRSQFYQLACLSESSEIRENMLQSLFIGPAVSLDVASDSFEQLVSDFRCFILFE